MIEPHVCRGSQTCCCYLLATEPDERCPVHGYPWPPRCEVCGRYMTWRLPPDPPTQPEDRP